VRQVQKGEKMDTQSKGKPLWASVFVIALGSAFFLTIEKIVDSVISNNYAIASNPITAASAYLLVGGWFGVLVSLFLGKVLGKHIPGHTRIELPKMRPTILAILAGIAAALATLIILWGNQLFDLSIIVAISNVFVLFVVIYEWLRGKVSAKTFLLPGVIVTISTVLVAYTPAWQESTVLQEQAGKLLVVLLGYNILVAFGSLITKPAVDQSDPVNVQIVRFIALAITGTIISIGLAIANGQWQEFVNACSNILSSPGAYLFLFLLFAAVFLGQVLELWAKRQNVDVSSVVIVIGMSVGLGFIAALVIDALAPGSVGEVPTDLATRIIRLLGVAGLIFATVLLQNKKAK